MRIAGVFLRDLEPFADQPLEFPTKPEASLAEVHFFVGQNGTGKTRLLSLLAAACGNPAELQFRTSKTFSAVVVDSTIDGNERFRYTSSIQGAVTSSRFDGMYLNFAKHPPAPGTSSFQLFDLNKDVAMAFRSAPTLVDQKVIPMGPVALETRPSFLTFSHQANESTLICQGLANLKVRMGIVSSDPKDRTVRMVQAFDRTIRSIADRDFLTTVGYVGSEFRLKAKWGGQEIGLKQLPDGLRAIIGWLASCMVKLDMIHPDIDNPLEQPVVLLLDEPDAHLHPAWQRKLIPAVQKLLPNAQIFIATHSPFVVSSVNHGWIHVFQADEQGIVKILPPLACSQGDSYVDVVEDILGVREQFDPETETLLRDFRAKRDDFKKQPKDESRLAEVKTLAQAIGDRSQTLSFMMGRELAQLDAQLNKVSS